MTELVHDPVRRQRLRFSREGEILHAEVWADPGGDVPAHYHPSQEERFEVLAGQGRVPPRRQRGGGGPGARGGGAAGAQDALLHTGETPRAPPAATPATPSRAPATSPRLSAASAGPCPPPGSIARAAGARCAASPAPIGSRSW